MINNCIISDRVGLPVHEKVTVTAHCRNLLFKGRQVVSQVEKWPISAWQSNKIFLYLLVLAYKSSCFCQSWSAHICKNSV